MALITCPECGAQVSDRATVCPKCAFPISELRTDGEVKLRYFLYWPYNLGIKVVNLKTNEVIFECDRKNNSIRVRTLEFNVDGETEIGFSLDATGYWNMALNAQYWKNCPVKVKVKPGQKYTLRIVPASKSYLLDHVDVIDTNWP